MLSAGGLSIEVDDLDSEDSVADDEQIKSKTIRFWSSPPPNQPAISSTPKCSVGLPISRGSPGHYNTSENFLAHFHFGQGPLPLSRESPPSLRSSRRSLASAFHEHSTTPPFRGISSPGVLNFTCSYSMATVDQKPNISTVGGDSHGSLVATKSLPGSNFWNSVSQGKSTEISILKFISSAKESCPFLPRVEIQQVFSDDVHAYIHLENYPTSLAHPQVAKRFCLVQNIGNRESTVQDLRFLAAELCIALSFLHSHGIVHQDVKPPNIMISKDGHAILGDFGAARVLPIVNQPYTPEERLHALFDFDTNVKYGSIVLQPNDIVTFTPAYASPELMERNIDGLLVYDERIDWWSLGLSLYEVCIGRRAFNEDICDPSGNLAQREVDVIKESDGRLHEFLQMLLVCDPAARLSGNQVTSHPFFDPLQGLWMDIKALRYPPCSHPPCMPSFTSSNSFFQMAILNPESEICRPSDSTSTSMDFDISLIPSRLDIAGPIPPGFADRRKEALEITRPAARIFEGYTGSHHPLDSEASMLAQKEFMSSHLDTINSSMQTFPSSASIVRFSPQDDGKYAAPPPPPMALRNEYENGEFGYCDIILEESERSFADSGLDLPLGESPESWGPRKHEEVQKPDSLRLVFTSEDGGARYSHAPKVEDSAQQPRRTGLAVVTPNGPQTGDQLTFEQQIAMSLLSAEPTKEREISEKQMKRRFTKISLFATSSVKAIRGVKKRFLSALRWR